MVGLVSTLRKADRGPSWPTQVRGTCREAQEQRQSTGCKAPGLELVEQEGQAWCLVHGTQDRLRPLGGECTGAGRSSS